MCQGQKTQITETTSTKNNTFAETKYIFKQFRNYANN